MTQRRTQSSEPLHYEEWLEQEDCDVARLDYAQYLRDYEESMYLRAMELKGYHYT